MYFLTVLVIYYNMGFYVCEGKEYNYADYIIWQNLGLLTKKMKVWLICSWLLLTRPFAISPLPHLSILFHFNVIHMIWIWRSAFVFRILSLPRKTSARSSEEIHFQKKTSEINVVVLAKPKRLTEFFLASALENIEVNNQETVSDNVFYV